jgi:hypothetical protein
MCPDGSLSVHGLPEHYTIILCCLLAQVLRGGIGGLELSKEQDWWLVVSLVRMMLSKVGMKGGGRGSGDHLDGAAVLDFFELVQVDNDAVRAGPHDGAVHGLERVSGGLLSGTNCLLAPVASFVITCGGFPTGVSGIYGSSSTGRVGSPG